MKINLQLLAMLMTSLSSLASYSFAQDCVECNSKTLAQESMPEKALDLKKAVDAPIELARRMERTPALAPTPPPLSQANYQSIFCDKFSMIEWTYIAPTIKEMEETPYAVDAYFQTSSCQPRNYGASVKCPLFHIIADSPGKRENFLNIMWLYYTKKRKDPSKFVEAVNFKNTKGETLLDYIESMKKDGMYPTAETQATVERIIATACSRGAVYAFYPNKKCP